MDIPIWAIKTKADERAIELGYYWDDKEAVIVKKFIEKCCYQSKGGWSGLPTVLDFQYKDIIAPLYSWKNPNGTPRFNTLLCYGSRKFGKSFLGSAICAYELIKKPRQEILVLASSIAQAKIHFDTIIGFSESPFLKERFKKPNEHLGIIKDRVGKSTLKVLSSTNTQGLSGWNSSVILLDEFAEIRKGIANEVWGRLKNSDLARKKQDGLKIVITTPQEDCHSHIAKQLWQNARDILDGKITDDLATLPVIYGASNDDDISSEETWKKANPGLGKIVPIEAYRKDWEQSKNDPRELCRFKTLLLGMWVASVDSFINSQTWYQNAEEFTEDDLKDLPCIMAIDYGGRYDLLSYVLLFIKDDTFYVIPKYMLPENVIGKKMMAENKNYKSWQDAKLIKTCPGDVIDFDVFHQYLKEDIEKYDIKNIVVDDFQMEPTRQWIENEMNKDVYTLKTWLFNEISPYTSQFEKLIKEGKIKHNNNPILNWNVESLTIKMNDHGLIRPDKKGAGKIDGAVALILSLVGIEQIDDGNFLGIDFS